MGGIDPTSRLSLLLEWGKALLTREQYIVDEASNILRGT